ncbi:MAG: hypothetical protein Q8Q09_07750 [Deltaproteobacteria bacterium]|nr:hypothetical protein [Deltaproteobacteria bacterium]
MEALNGQRQDIRERVGFQQRATVADQTREAAMRTVREHRGAGEVDGNFAAAGRMEINWQLYRTDGDYAAGVRRSLENAARDPSTVQHLFAFRNCPMRESL